MADSDYLKVGIERFLHDFNVPKAQLEMLGRFLALKDQPNVTRVELSYAGPDYYEGSECNINMRSAQYPIDDDESEYRPLEFRLKISLKGAKSLQDVGQLLDAMGIPSNNVTKYNDKCYALEQDQINGFRVEFDVV